MNVGLIHADGKLPNLALMRLSTHFKEQGTSVGLYRVAKQVPWGEVDALYGSSIFEFSQSVRERFWGQPKVMWGGTGVDKTSSLNSIAVRNWDRVAPDYSLYPDYQYSLGFTQRGCRLKCKFCVVPIKEGKPTAVGSIANIWRGPQHPKKVVLLDNDFFGQPETEWQARVDELREGKFRVSFCQGINIRQVDVKSAHALATLEYRDNEFQRRRLYTAWDNLGDESIFERGVDLLRGIGVPPKHLMVYMLIGFRKDETWEQIFHRFDKLVRLGCLPFPMVYLNNDGSSMSRKHLKAFQRWVVTGLYRHVPWKEYRDPRLLEAV